MMMMMSLSTKIIGHTPFSLSLSLLGSNLQTQFSVAAFLQIGGGNDTRTAHHSKLPFNNTRFRILCTNDNHPRRSDAHGFPDAQESQSFVSDKGSEANNQAGKQTLSSREMFEKLKRYGTSGILSYGILNTIYYLTTFLVVWFYVAPVPGKMGYFAAAERFLKVMAMVWAGSQVTKLIRLAGAIALAPLVSRGLSWFTVKFSFKSQGKASMAIVLFCLGLAASLFLVVTLLWA